MRSERWKVVEQILEAALEKAPAARAAFLAASCQGDEELRREVETLIRAYDQAGSFIEALLLPSISTVPLPHSPHAQDDSLYLMLQQP